MRRTLYGLTLARRQQQEYEDDERMSRYVLDNGLGLDMRLFVFGYPTAAADTVRACLDRWTLAEREGGEFWVSWGSFFLEKPQSCSHIPPQVKVAVRSGSGDGLERDYGL